MDPILRFGYAGYEDGRGRYSLADDEAVEHGIGHGSKAHCHTPGVPHSVLHVIAQHAEAHCAQAA